MKKAQFEEIYALAFSDPTRWRRWFVDEVVTDTADDDIFIVPDSAGRPSASALMKPYGFMYRGVCLPSGYISCVATKPEARTRGLASIAVQEALSEAVRRGYAFCELIPANRSLYSFYCRFGFADGFYADEERYTSLHEFSDGIGEAIEPTYAVFHGLEERLGCSIIHSETDYRRIIKDLSFESGRSVAFVRGEGGYACLFASWDASRDDATVTVRSLLADSESLAMGALGVLRAEVGERPFTVLRPPLSGEKAHLRVKGMARMVDPLQVLSAMAASKPTLRTTIRISDHLFEENSGYYIISDGKCRRSETAEGYVDLDVPVDVLTSILFSSEKTGEIFGLPTRRPYMAMMLD